MAFKRSAVRSRLAPPALARSAKADWSSMKYVYILQSVAEPERYYTGITDDLKLRLTKHIAKEVAHTSKYAPW